MNYASNEKSRLSGRSVNTTGPLLLRRVLRTLLIPAALAFPLLESVVAQDSASNKSVDLSKDKTLYVVGYAHLDTQWRWDYQTVIDNYISKTLTDNFALLEKYPDYVFTFTGATRYAMMKEYYPEDYKKMKGFIASGRWHVGGSSVEENDANIPSPESEIRHVLYGNRFFQREFGKTSVDAMLPDCFGFQGFLPTVWAHCGLKGFSTQKLTWGSAVGIPFNVGRWIGPDGRSVVCALDPGVYLGAIKARLDTDPAWVKRVNANGEKYGVFADLHYYGVGDRGGAPREEDVKMLVENLHNPDGHIRILPASGDQLFRDITPKQAECLPSYTGDLLLTEHSAGTLTSQACMKRWNRKNEQLADAAERAAVAARWVGDSYPFAKIERAWWRVLGSQMHDIMPGTCLPRCYDYSWNDETLGFNEFSTVLEHASETIISTLDTRVQGRALVVFNPLAIEREDVVEATLDFPDQAPEFVRVFDANGAETPSQILSRKGGSLRLLFLARMPSVAFSTFDVRAAEKPCELATRLKADSRNLENAAYKVILNDAGDVAGILDKQNGNRQILAAPAQLQFLFECPKIYPAWNMDWADRQKPPMGVVDGPATIRVIENGPVRVAIEVVRKARNSIFTQQIRLCAGDAGARVEFPTQIDWQSQACSLKAAFPLAVANPKATYNYGMGVVERLNNDPKKYEVPSREWFDLTEAKGGYGVSILEDCKFGSDKPDDSTLRLTLLYTPGVRKDYLDQATQDFGRHDMLYALYGHKGDWRDGGSEWQGRRINQPLVAFLTPSHKGSLGRTFSLLNINTPQVDVRTVKQSEDGKAIIIRLQELWGRDAKNVQVGFAAPIREAIEIDGQERPLDKAPVRDGKLQIDTTAWSPRSFAIVLEKPSVQAEIPVSRPVALAFDTNVATSKDKPTEGEMANGLSYPAEEFPSKLETESGVFQLGGGAPGAKNAVTCRGQRIALPKGQFNRVEIVASATEDTIGDFSAGESRASLKIPAWTGFIGQFDRRVWNNKAENTVTGLESGFIKRTPVAWFCTHRHNSTGNEAYHFSYLFKVSLPMSPGTETLVLPTNENIRIFAVNVENVPCGQIAPAHPLYDDYSSRGPLELRKADTPADKPAEAAPSPLPKS